MQKSNFFNQKVLTMLKVKNWPFTFSNPAPEASLVLTLGIASKGQVRTTPLLAPLFSLIPRPDLDQSDAISKHSLLPLFPVFPPPVPPLQSSIWGCGILPLGVQYGALSPPPPLPPYPDRFSYLSVQGSPEFFHHLHKELGHPPPMLQALVFDHVVRSVSLPSSIPVFFTSLKNGSPCLPTYREAMTEFCSLMAPLSFALGLHSEQMFSYRRFGLVQVGMSPSPIPCPQVMQTWRPHGIPSHKLVTENLLLN